MSDPTIVTMLATLALLGLGLSLLAGLRGWQGWLELKRLELAGRGHAGGPAAAMERIEIADLKERIRKLEAIAACVDL